MTFQLKIGNIVSGRSLAQGNTFQVRVLPDMELIAETDLLPWFPNFTSSLEISYKVRDTVWCLVNEDYTVGFILERTQPPAGSDILTVMGSINKAEKKAGYSDYLLSSYGELTITRFSGKSFAFSNETKGTSGIFYTDKTVYIFGADGSFWMQSPFMSQSVDAKGSMVFTLNKDLTKNVQSETSNVKGNSLESVATKDIDASGNIRVHSGGALTLGGNTITETSYGKSITVSGLKSETIAAGETKTILAGGSTTTIGGGAFTLSVALGAVTISAPIITLNSPLIKLPSGNVFPTGTGGLCALPFCLFSGAPHVGVALTGPGV